VAHEVLAPRDRSSKDAAIDGLPKGLRARPRPRTAERSRPRRSARSRTCPAAMARSLAPSTPGGSNAWHRPWKRIAALPDRSEPCFRMSDVRTNACAQGWVPIGVIAIVYESRRTSFRMLPHSGVKAGKRVILRGVPRQLTRTLSFVVSFPMLSCARAFRRCVQMLPPGDRDSISESSCSRRKVDLAIPRGGEGSYASCKRMLEFSGHRSRPGGGVILH